MSEVIKKLTDLTYLDWTKSRHSSGTAGSFLKAYEKHGNKKTYYKLSNYEADKGIVGHECVNEIIACRLLDLLGVKHLSYTLVHAKVMVRDIVYETYLCRSEDFKKPGDSKVALDAYYDMEHLQNESPIGFCLRQGWDSFIYDMLTIDYLILNRDRHGANIEILRNRYEKSVRPAPLFDQGLSLTFSTEENELESVDFLADKKIQCFVGGSSSFENLKLIPAEKMKKLPDFNEELKAVLFKDLDGVISRKRIETDWKFLRQRAEAYENLRNKRQYD